MALRVRDAFLVWFALGLAASAVGLATVAVESALGSPLSWTGRTAQSLSQVYILVGLVGMARRRGTSGPDLARAFDDLKLALRQTQQRYKAITASINEGFYIAEILYDEQGKPCDYVYLDVNPAFERIVGIDRDRIIGMRYTDMVPDVSATWLKAFSEVATTGKPARRCHFAPAVGRWYDTISYRPAEGLFAAVFSDVTDRKRAEEELSRTAQRLEILSGTAAQLLTSDDPQRVIQSLCERVRHHLGCEAFFNYLLDNESGQLRLNACAGVGEETAARIDRIEDCPEVCDCPAGRGRVTVCQDIQGTSDPLNQIPRSCGTQACAGFPLLAGPRKVIGTLVFGTSSRLRFSDDDLSLMKTVADQVAIALHRVRVLEADRRAAERAVVVYEREHKIAETLQKALIPEEAYHIPGLDVAVVYEAASDEARVGGDFYDVFGIGEGRVGVLIGDVSGKGLAAAIRVAETRHTIRSYAYLDPRASRVLGLANNALCRIEKELSDMTTAFLAVLDTRTGAMTFANAGHETPVILRADGTVEELDVEGCVFAAGEDQVYLEDELVLHLGDVVVMLTDGITEARPDAEHFFGTEGVRAYLEAVPRPASPHRIATGLLDAVKAHAGGRLSDDAAIVAFSLTD
jgi:PAS domain S-box-containing protein